MNRNYDRFGSLHGCFGWWLVHGFIVFFLMAVSTFGDVIPSTHRINWEPGVSVGNTMLIPYRTNLIDFVARGGTTNDRIDITGTIATDTNELTVSTVGDFAIGHGIWISNVLSSIITNISGSVLYLRDVTTVGRTNTQLRHDNAPVLVDLTGPSGIAVSNDVVDFSTHGLYRFISGAIVRKSGITLRGRGPMNTTWFVAGPNALSAGTATATDIFSVTNFATKGSRTIIFSDTNTGVARPIGGGQKGIISALFTGSESWPYISSAGFARRLKQHIAISNVIGFEATLTQPLMFDFTNTAIVEFTDYPTDVSQLSPKQAIQIDGFTFTVTNVNTGEHKNPQQGGAANTIYFGSVWNSQITNCVFEPPNGYSLQFEGCAYITVERVWIKGAGVILPGHGGFLQSDCTAILCQDSIFSHEIFPAMETQGWVSGAVWAYNFTTNCSMSHQFHGGETVMSLIDGCKGSLTWHADGYFGSQSFITWFRNWMDTLLVKRFNSQHSIVGNVFGRSDMTNGIIQIGYPNIGNGYYGWNVMGAAQDIRVPATNPPTSFGYPGPTMYDFHDQIVWTNGAFVTTNSVTDQTNLIGDYSYIFLGSANNGVAFQNTNSTNVYLYFDGVRAVTHGTSSNLHLSKPVTVPAGYRVYNIGTDAFQQLALNQISTLNIHGNQFFTNGLEVSWNPNIADHNIQNTMLTTNATWWNAATGKPLWWDEDLQFPCVDAETGRTSMNPAQKRYLAAMGQGGDTPSQPKGKKLTRGIRLRLKQ